MVEDKEDVFGNVSTHTSIKRLCSRGRVTARSSRSRLGLNERCVTRIGTDYRHNERDNIILRSLRRIELGCQHGLSKGLTDDLSELFDL